MNRKEGRKKSLLLYDSDELFNQFYIDRVNFGCFCPEAFIVYHYEEALMEVVNNPMFLGRIKDRKKSKKMCEVALHKNVNSIKFVPIDLLGELYICFDAKYKKSEDKKHDGIIIDAILGKIEALGMSLQEIDCYGGSVKRRMMSGGEIFYESNGQTDKDAYIKDKNKFKVLKNSSSIFNDMSYDEVLATLGNYDGMLLKELDVDHINEKICEAALMNEPKASRYVPKRYFYVSVREIKRQQDLSSRMYG